jgi:opacity protein-like surface antigen
MKKLTLIIAAIALFTVGANAQETFQQGTKLLKATLSFNSNGFPLGVSYEKGIKNNVFDVEKLNLGLGAYFGYYGYSTTASNFGGTSKSSFKIIAPGVNSYLHYQLMPKLDAYLGASLGLTYQRGKTEASGMEDKTENKLKFAWGIAAGLRYEITSQWGAFIEGGHGTGNCTLGVAYKF